MSIYVDHAASSPPSETVLAYYRDVLAEYAYNPSSQHEAGKKARALIDQALEQAAACFGVSPDQLIVTSGGTEAINQVIACYETPRRFTPHLVVTDGEHKAVTAVAARLETAGCKTTYLPLDAKGRPTADQFTSDPALPPTMVSAILLSNETGALTDTKALAAWRDAVCPHAVIHLDAVQAAGKMPLDLDALGADFLSVSGHKWGAPMGIGLIVARSLQRLTPLIAGAGQQHGLRSGSENAPLLAATSFALKQATDALPAFQLTAAARKRELLALLQQRQVPFDLVSPQDALPHIVAIAFPLMGETLARVLSDQGIYIGRGAACSGGKAGQNRALTALGADANTIQRTVRVSFGPETTEADVHALADAIAAAVDRFRTI